MRVTLALIVAIASTPWPASSDVLTAVATVAGPADFLGCDPAVGIDGAGNTVYAWGRRDGTRYFVETRVRASNGTLEDVALVANEPSLRCVRLRVAPTGDAVFAWNTGAGVVVRRRGATRVFGDLETVSGPFLEDFEVDAAGNAVFVWTRPDASGRKRVETRRWLADGSWSDIEYVSAAARHSFAPRIAVNADGAAAFTWLTQYSGRIDRVHARIRPVATGSLTAMLTLSEIGIDAFGPDVGIDAAGNAVFAWQEKPGPYAIRARIRFAGGALSSIRVIGKAAYATPAARVVVDDAGNATVAWALANPGRVMARVRPAGGDWSPLQQIVSDITSPHFAFGHGAAGAAVFVWPRWNDVDDVLRVQTRTRAIDGTLSPVATVASGAKISWLGAGSAAVNPDGDVDFLWGRTGLRYGYLQARTLLAD